MMKLKVFNFWFINQKPLNWGKNCVYPLKKIYLQNSSKFPSEQKLMVDSLPRKKLCP